MTPDQALKTALLGEAPQARGKPAKTKRSRRFRWTLKLLAVALSLMLTRGLMQAPEVRAMFNEGVATVEAFLAEERARVEAKAAAAVADTLQGMAETPEVDAPAMFEDRVKVRRPSESEAPRMLTGPAAEVLAGNALLIEGVPVVIDGLACAAPGSDAGQKALRGMEEITRSQNLNCRVTGAMGEHAVKASCTLKGGRDLASAMQADRLCEAG